MQTKPFILLMLLTMSAASRAATDDSFMGVSWLWILALSLYAVIGVILVLALCKTAAASDAIEEKTYEAILEQARAAAVAPADATVDSRIAGRWSPRPYRLDLNLADFEPQFLDIHILSSDVIMVRVDDVETLEVG